MVRTTRRQFIETMAVGSAAAGLATGSTARVAAAAPRRAGQTSVAGLMVPALDRVRLGFVGVGERGAKHVARFARLDGVEIAAICDIDAAALQRAQGAVAAAGRPVPAVFGGDDAAYQRMLEAADIDAVVIATPWQFHAPQAMTVMQSGRHALVEVPAALTIDECWQLVDTAEQTQRNCMMLENVCYGRTELMVLNMVRQGLFGELLHGEAAYIHNLRFQMAQLDHGPGSWRTDWHAKRNANLYPTHGLGPIAQYIGINRGDRFDYLTSVASPARGRALYARTNFPPDHPRNQAEYVAGDINTSLIKTRAGRSIMVQFDTTTPRPYSRHNLVQGTKGVFAGFPNRIALDGADTYEAWDTDMDPWREKYDHPLWTRLAGHPAFDNAHGGMDFIMSWRIVDCLRNAEPLDQDVYDAAAWSAVTPLSESSVSQRGAPQDFPDFTRGAWDQRTPLPVRG